MADNGIRTTNLDGAGSAPAVEVLVHADVGGGALGLRRQAIEVFVQRLVGLAGLDPSVVAELSLRLTSEIARATGAEGALDDRVDAINLGLSSAIKFELLADRFIDGVYYKWAVVTDTYSVVFGITFDGQYVMPGVMDLSRDGVFAAEHGFSADNGAVSNYLVPRADGKRTYVRGWEARLGLPILSHFPMLSQSNGFFADGNLILSPNDRQLGVMTPRRGVRTWSDAYFVAPNAINRGRAAFKLDPFVDKPVSANGESHIVSFTSQFKAAQAGGKFAAADLSEMAPYLVWTNANRGERFLKDLGPDGTYGHFEAWVDDVAKLAQEALRNGWTYGIPGILFMQGEAETRGQLESGGPFLGFSDLQTGLVARYISYRQRYETAAKASAASVNMPLPNRPIPWFIVQTAFVWSGEAQRRAALADDAIYGVATMYQGASGLNGEQSYLDPNTGARITGRGATVHQDADNQRWIGELAGKNTRRILLEGLDVRPLEMTDAVRIADTEVLVKFAVPYPPLQFETGFLPNVANRGFQVRLGTPDAPSTYLTITSVDLLTDRVMINLDPTTPLVAGQAAHIVIGEVVDVRTTPTGPTAVDTTGTRANGQPSVRLTMAGDQRAQFADLIIQGAFQANQPGIGKGMSVFEVIYDATANTTTLVGEQRLYTGPMQAGVPLSLQRDRPWCNLHDSDPAISHNVFQAPWSGMIGRPYPMWNWCWFGIQTVRT